MRRPKSPEPPVSSLATHVIDVVRRPVTEKRNRSKDSKKLLKGQCDTRWCVRRRVVYDNRKGLNISQKVTKKVLLDFYKFLVFTSIRWYSL